MLCRQGNPRLTTPLTWLAYRAGLPAGEIGGCLAGLQLLQPTTTPMQQLVKELGRLVESVPQVRTLPALARLLDHAIAGLQQGAGPAVTFAVPIQVS